MTRLLSDPHCRVIFDDGVEKVELTTCTIRAPLQSDRILSVAIGMSHARLSITWHDAGIRVGVHVDKSAGRGVLLKDSPNRFEATNDEALEGGATKLIGRRKQFTSF